MPVILLLILLMFYLGSAIAERNFLPLGLNINSNLNLIHNFNSSSNPSCSIDGNNYEQAKIFEDYATDQLGLKEGCLKEICPNIQANRNKSYEVDSPLNPRYKDLDSQLMPVKLALKKMLLAEAALEKDQHDRSFAKELQNKSISITPKVSLVVVSSLVKAPLALLTKSNLSNPSDSSAKDNYQKKLVELYSNFLGPADGQSVAAVVIKMSQDKRVAATGANFLGAPYRYKKQYPDLSFQKAVRTDLEETKLALENAPDEVKEIVLLAGLDTKLNERITHADSNIMIDEIDGQDISKTTDQIQNILVLHKHTSGNPELSQRATKKLFELTKTQNLDIKETLVLSDLPDDIEKKSLASFYSLFSHSQKPATTKSLLLYQDCLYNFAASAISLPSKNELDKFSSKLPEMRKTLEKAVQGKYSHVSGQILSEFIQTVPVYLPPAKDDYLNKVESQLNTITQRAEHILSVRNKNISDAAIIEVLTGDENSALNKRIPETCKKLSFRPVRDNTVPIIGGVSMGSDSVKNESFGLGALAHELGHNMQTILNTNPKISEESRAKHQKAEKCLIDQHKPFFDKLSKYNENKSQSLQDPRKPDHFLDEDYADLIGASTSNDSNFYCEFGPDGLSWGPGSGDLDTHSSGLFRVLHIEAASNRKLPEKCQQFLNLNDYSLKKCF